MSNEIYKKFLSSGFGEANAKSSRHMIELYKHNYSRYLPSDKSARILDIGCGMGQFLEFLGTEGYANFLGIDVSPEAIAYCEEKGISCVKQIDDLNEYLATSGMYDVVVLNDVIEHFQGVEVIPILRKIHEKLNVGGIIIVKTGNLSSLVGPRMRYIDFTHYLGFTEYSLEQVLKVAGFGDIMMSPFVFPKNRLTRLIRFVIQKFIHAFWKLTYFFEFTGVPKIVDELIFVVGKKL